jgi:YHS domain-containing protein
MLGLKGLNLRSAFWLGALIVCAALLQGCGGTLYATVKDERGRDVMLIGRDPVAYFTEGRPVPGRASIAAELPGRTYYFASERNRAIFQAAPAKYEPQYGGFCANGMAYGLKMSTDPGSWVIFQGRLFIFGDILGKEQWSLTPAFNAEKGDLMWASEAKDTPWREQTWKRWTNRVPWYKSRWAIREEWEKANPGRPPLTYDPGGWFTNLLFKYPGWRALEGYSQPKIELPRD